MYSLSYTKAFGSCTGNQGSFASIEGETSHHVRYHDFESIIPVYLQLLSSRVANNISSYDTSKYRISVVPSAKMGRLAFHLGEHIQIHWQAPPNHSRKDWIGLYRVSRCYTPDSPVSCVD